MLRKWGLVLSAVGTPFVVMPLSNVLATRDFVLLVIGFGFVLVGIFFSIEAVAQRR
jgi:hypothetical protein